jgi:hypothetical protein
MSESFMEHDAQYRERVVGLMTTELIGDLDGDTPKVTIERIVDTTVGSSGSVLRLEVHARVHGRAYESPTVFDWREWEEYTDQSPESMAAGLAVLIRTDIREEIATVIPPGYPGAAAPP